MSWIGRALVVGCLVGCPSASPPPGDEQMGRYSFRAEPVDPGGGGFVLPDGGTAPPCGFAAVPDGGFDFEASFSRFRDAGLYYVTIGGVAHDAVWDGQVITATYGAQRNFSECQCERLPDGGPIVVRMTETLTATIVSRSQSDAVGGCVENPPFDPAGGVVRPDTTDGGSFDAVRACGTLQELVQAETPVGCSAQCNGCVLRYAIQGERR